MEIIDNNFGSIRLFFCFVLLLTSAYGCEVGSAAIKFIPTGGMFVTGGLTPKNIKFIEGQDSPFMQAYKDKGRVSPILESVPLFAVMVEDLGVRGAHKSAQLVRKCKSKEVPWKPMLSSSFIVLPPTGIREISLQGSVGYYIVSSIVVVTSL